MKPTKLSLEFGAKRPSDLPWNKTFKRVRERCNDPKNGSYSRYGGKGIKCLITPEELRTIWIRDKAHLMEKASINRKDSSKDYTFDNCEYIEQRENARLGNIRGTHCVHGHAYEPNNLGINSCTGWAFCRICQRNQVKKCKQRKQEAIRAQKQGRG